MRESESQRVRESENGQHRSLVEARARLRGTEIVFAYFDDVYAACGLLRVASVHTAVEEELFIHANVHVHHGSGTREE